MHIRGWQAALVLAFGLVTATGCARKQAAIQPEFGDGGTRAGTQASNIANRDGEFDDTELPDIASQGAMRDRDLLAKIDELGPVYFDYDSAALRSDAQVELDRHAAYLRAHAGLRIQIEGHCDERGTLEYNLALGERRAQAVRKYLVSQGISADRLYTISYGEERPAVLGHDESAWRWNRRAEFRVAR